MISAVVWRDIELICVCVCVSGCIDRRSTVCVEPDIPRRAVCDRPSCFLTIITVPASLASVCLDI